MATKLKSRTLSGVENDGVLDSKPVVRKSKTPSDLLGVTHSVAPDGWKHIKMLTTMAGPLFSICADEIVLTDDDSAEAWITSFHAVPVTLRIAKREVTVMDQKVVRDVVAAFDEDDKYICIVRQVHYVAIPK